MTKILGGFGGFAGREFGEGVLAQVMLGVTSWHSQLLTATKSQSQSPWPWPWVSLILAEG